MVCVDTNILGCKVSCSLPITVNLFLYVSLTSCKFVSSLMFNLNLKGRKQKEKDLNCWSSLFKTGNPHDCHSGSPFWFVLQCITAKSTYIVELLTWFLWFNLTQTERSSDWKKGSGPVFLALCALRNTQSFLGVFRPILIPLYKIFEEDIVQIPFLYLCSMVDDLLGIVFTSYCFNRKISSPSHPLSLHCITYFPTCLIVSSKAEFLPAVLTTHFGSDSPLYQS